jgi:hypothetical protein
MNMKFIDIPVIDRREVLDQLQTKIGLQSSIIEKDWWVTTVLKALFELPYAHHLSLKGGTSLSKCWKIIQRMSEDIDIAIDREYLGFTGLLSKNQISNRLRRAVCSFVRDKMQFDLRNQLIADGVNPNSFEVKVNITPITTTDPEVILVAYPSATDVVDYVPSVVKIEVSGRSMSEPVEEVEIQSMIDEALPTAVFHEDRFKIRAVLPKRTFLEKLFLLHEEFSKETSLIRVERMSRHIYDIEQMMHTPVVEEALNDDELYHSVIEHRRIFIGLKGFDYSTLAKNTLNVIPPQSVYNEWERDYENMRKNMIYVEAKPFNELIDELRSLNERIKAMG